MSASESAKQVTFLRTAEVEAEATRWLWEGRIPLGAVTLLAGRQGLGKSTVTCGLAAQVSRGTLPGDLIGVPSTSLLLSYEDHLASTIVPRLTASDADLNKVEAGRAEMAGAPDLISLPDDLVEVAARAKEVHARLLIVDPLVASLPGTDAHRDGNVRAALAPLARLAEEADLAVLATIHFNKGQGTDVLSRISGSIAFTAAARSVLAFGCDPRDPEGDQGNRRVLVHSKCNVGPQARAVACTIEASEVTTRDGVIPTSRIAWREEIDVSSAELLSASGDDEERTEAQEAAEWLRVELGDGLWHPSREVKEAGRRRHYSSRTIQRASKMAGVETRRIAAYQGTTEWRLLSVAPGGGAPLDETTPGATEEHGIPEGNPAAETSCRAAALAPGATENDWTVERAEAEIERHRTNYPEAEE